MEIKKGKKRKGFTLIELVIVLAVLAIIALIAIPNFTKVRQDSLKKADMESCNQIEKITLMSIANEDITYGSGGVINITFPTNAPVATPEVKTGDTKTEKVTVSIVGNNYKEYLKDVKAPQYNDATNYVVTIKDDGSVSVTTDTMD